MKIDYIANVRMPTEKAHGLQIIKMCEAWANFGHEVTLWAPDRFNPIKRDPFDFYSVKKIFLIKKVFTFDLLPLDKFLGKIAFWTENLSFAVFVAARLSFKKRDIIFCRDFWSAYFLSLLGKKVIYEIHDLPNRHLITRRAFKKIWKFVSTNLFKADDLVNTFGLKRERVFVAPNGVSLEFFDVKENQMECRRMLGLPQEGIIALYTGHFYSWKGADTLLKAAREISKNITVVFVGGTLKDAQNFENMSRGYENIKIFGHQEYKKIPYFMRAADILILPNTAREDISLRETSPIKLFEYMASRKPIIASDIPSVREIVSENQVIFFEPDNVCDLKQKIETAAVEYDRFLPLTDAAYDEVKKYSWRGRAENILKFVLKTS